MQKIEPFKAGLVVAMFIYFFDIIDLYDILSVICDCLLSIAPVTAGTVFVFFDTLCVLCTTQGR